MKIKLILEDWQRNGKSIANTTECNMPFLNAFHSGCTFDGNIVLTKEQRLELLAAIAAGYTPVFWIDIDMED